MSSPQAPVAAAPRSRLRWRFALVLVASLLLAVAQPLVAKMFGDQWSFDAFFAGLIGAVLLLVFEEQRHRAIAVSLGLLAVLGIATGHAIGGPAGMWFLVASHLLAASFFAFALYNILRAILAKHVSSDAIFGAICGYLLLGIIWGLLYYSLEISSPGAFRAAAGEPIDRGTLGYYSFITLATVGYGDITPITPLARTLAWLEAVAGQFYLAILVAGLVGFKVTQAMND